MSDNESEITWYIARDGQQHGPLSDAEMRLFVAGGHLRPNDLVWKPGFTDWRPAATIFPPQAGPIPAPPMAQRPPTDGRQRPAPDDPARTTDPGRARSDSPQSHGATPATENTASPAAPQGNDRSAHDNAHRTNAGGRGDAVGRPLRDGGSHADGANRGDPRLTADRRSDSATGSPASGDMRARADSGHFAPAAGSPSRGEPQFEARTRSSGSNPSAETGRLGPALADGPGRERRSLGGDGSRNNGMSLDHRHDDRDQYAGREYDDSYDSDGAQPPSSGRVKRLATAAVILAILGGGGYAAYENRETIGGWLEAATQATTGDGSTSSRTPVVLAPPAPQEAAREAPAEEPRQTAARTTFPQQPSAFQPSGPPMQGVVVTMPPPQPAEPEAADSPATIANAADPGRVTPDVIDANFQKSELWSLMKREFPDWYGQRVQEVAAKSAGNEATDVSGYLINELVALRRKHANEALSASNDKLREVAQAFLANLKNLSTHSTDTCFEFISKGEASKTVIELFPREAYGNTIEAQIAAVFEAVAEGRKTPVSRQAAQKPDYDLLAMELGKIGWTQDDLKLFANPKALSEAPRERVCKMVQDWFQAHIDIQDRSVQDRLLFVTLRPVIAG